MSLVKLLLILMIFFTGCYDNRSSADEFDVLANILDTKNSRVAFDSSMNVSLDSPVGIWRQSYFFYSASLVIDKQGEFCFLDHGCLGGTYTRGRWTNQNGHYVLTSFDEFKGKSSDQKADTRNTPIFFNGVRVRAIDDSLYVSGRSTFSRQTASD